LSVAHGGGGGDSGCDTKTLFVLKRFKALPFGPGSFSGTLLVGWPSGVTFISIEGKPEVVPAAVTEDPLCGTVTRAVPSQMVGQEARKVALA
jgi:hypothetical protein